MATKVLVLFYSTYGHMFAMAKAAAAGATAAGATVTLKRVPETLPTDVLAKMGAVEAQKAFADVPIATAAELADYDAIIFGSPTRFGNMAAQMKAFFDATGGLWGKGALVGKVGGCMTSSATQHGGNEATLLSMHTVLLHHGFIIVGLPYAFASQMGVEEVKGGSPYGATTIAGGQGERQPSTIELDGAKFQGKRIAEIAAKLARK